MERQAATHLLIARLSVDPSLRGGDRIQRVSSAHTHLAIPKRTARRTQHRLPVLRCTRAPARQPRMALIPLLAMPGEKATIPNLLSAVTQHGSADHNLPLAAAAFPHLASTSRATRPHRCGPKLHRWDALPYNCACPPSPIHPMCSMATIAPAHATSFPARSNHIEPKGEPALLGKGLPGRPWLLAPTHSSRRFQTEGQPQRRRSAPREPVVPYTPGRNQARSKHACKE
mmetsp:Transcript_130160/g.278146  ORF Transcript_130160/g.278146 Transcript_130160/m.278146 type:complete len:229 (-) Transcript_130160:477-1163(-)